MSHGNNYFKSLYQKFGRIVVFVVIVREFNICYLGWMSFVPCFIHNSFVYIFVWYVSYTEWLDWYQWIKKIKSLAVFTHFSITCSFYSCRNWTNKCIKTDQSNHMSSNDDPDHQDELQPYWCIKFIFLSWFINPLMPVAYFQHFQNSCLFSWKIWAICCSF